MTRSASKLQLQQRSGPPAQEMVGICGGCGRAGAKPYPFVWRGEVKPRFRCDEHVPSDVLDGDWISLGDVVEKIFRGQAPEGRSP